MAKAAWNGTIAAIVAALVCHQVRSEDISRVRGSLLFAGGELRFDNGAVWQRFMQLAGGKDAFVVIVPTASSEPEKVACATAENFRKYGAKVDIVPIAPWWQGINPQAAAADPANVATLRRANGIWFTGGRQDRILKALIDKGGGQTAALKAIWEAYRGGAVVGGTSAGTAIMSQTMFFDPRGPLDSLKYGLGEKGVARGLGFVGNEWFVDQHFLARGRFARAALAMRDNHYKYGIGVDEDTAVVLKEGKFDVIGYKGALILDISEATTDPNLREFNMKGVRLTYLDSGDRMDCRTREILVSERKMAGKKIDPSDKDFIPEYRGDRPSTYPDMLGAWAIYTAMYHVLDSKSGLAEGVAMDPWDNKEKKDLGFEFKLYRKCGDTNGWSSEKNGNSSYTVRNVYMDIMPVKLQAFPLYKHLKP